MALSYRPSAEAPTPPSDKKFTAEKAELCAVLDSYHRRWNPELVESAFDFAVEAHKNQKRRSGLPYFVHPLAVAKILAEMKLDYIAITASLLHDVVEDCGVSVHELEEKFGPTVALLVDGVTKISERQYPTYAAKQADSLRKMLLSTMKDLRVILIKLADRLHNMTTLDAMPPKVRERIANETRDVYAPLAHRLGVGRLARRLEDETLRVLHPDEYKEIYDKIEGSVEERQAILEEIMGPIRSELNKNGISCEVQGRVKSISSIYNKIHQRNKVFDEILDMLAIRIIVQTNKECYTVLGIVHEVYHPVLGLFTDYIALPKSNLYQSLHTKVRDAKGRIVEVQIRTEQMHALAQDGIYAHWRYKQGTVKSDELDDHFTWIRSLMEQNAEGATTGDFLDSLKVNLYQDEILAFTPKGDLVQLPIGSTPVDFAYYIHTDVGHHTIAAKVKGKMVPLSYRLESGDVVDILTSPRQTPSADWLTFIHSPKARAAIKKWLVDTRWDQAKTLGEEMITAEIARLKLKPDNGQLEEVAVSFGHNRLTDFYAALGMGELMLGQVMIKLVPKLTPDKESLISRIVRTISHEQNKVRVSGLDNLMVSIADCCNPLPGDPIIGFQSTGKGLVIHRTDCAEVAPLLNAHDQLVSVMWDVELEREFKAQVHIVADDRKNLLRDIAQVVSEMGVNVHRIEIHIEDKLAIGALVVEVRNLPHLTRLISKINSLRGVLKVDRQVIDTHNDEKSESEPMADIGYF